ncbi:hypothetical protein D7Z26_17760 [Cohnella endophytica]|uniref:Class 1 isoprenoid biosynthesis enzyme n=1 Tax=Cohnella endophytica TaxID=2419778 RepID=A0A494XVK7_9BACL|nr:hypothetical protein [Cohnella endophytica]RKP51623.1 hypothetical protein D7Z26_17760 [Cohnella endophytica]
MSFADKYAEEIAELFSAATTETTAFPAPLNGLGLALLDKLNPLTSGAGTNYIAFLLPYWLREQTACSGVLCRDLAIGNVFAMVHFFLLDDAMDSETGVGGLPAREALALGQLFQAAFQRRYGRHFAADSPIWTYYRRYLEQWASAVSQEGALPADPSDSARLAAKSAPVKLCAAGMLLLSGQEQRIPELEQAIDLVLATLQLSDDWTDWNEDLQDGGHGNAFLTIVRETLGVEPDQPLEERSVRRAIYRANALEGLSRIARSYGERLMTLANVPERLLEMQEMLQVGLEKDASDAERKTNELASEGGLSYILSKFATK